MPHHRRSRPRKQRRPDARWLITGIATPTILHHNQQAYLQPVRAGDHPRRYAKGQRLQLKPYVPGPTEAHVIVTSAERIPVAQITDQIAVELGHHGQDTFRLAWIYANDTDWWQAMQAQHDPSQGGDGDLEQADRKLAARFQARWTTKLAWLIRFRIDRAAAPRMLAAIGGDTGGSFITGPDGRHHYQPRDDERESDRGYTSSDALATRDELPALTDEQWNRHIGPGSPFRDRERLRQQRIEREARTLEQRLAAAQSTARSKGYDIRDESRRLERLIGQGDAARARQQIALIEQRVYPQAA